MTQEDKQLLLIDLCARLPHGVKVCYKISDKDNLIIETLSGHMLDYFNENLIVEVKPYLRPMSSMTEEEKKEYDKLCGYCLEQDPVDYNISTLDRTQLIFVIEWLNEHYFDYHGLIEKGLALEAPEEMYKTK